MNALRLEIQSLRDKWRDQPKEPFYDELSDLLFKAGKITAAMNLMESSVRVPDMEQVADHSSAADSADSQMDDAFGMTGSEGAWWFRRGMDYADACLFEEASACLNRALVAGADDFETHYCLAGIYKSLERPDKAEQHCRLSMRHNPGFAPTFLLLAAISRMTGRVEDSADAARMAVLLEPDCAPAHYDLACYYALAGEEDKALSAFEAALSKGFCDFDWVNSDPDLARLRGRPEFGDLLRSYTTPSAT
jgi:tetratricopeptide (TPR) repeat protein